MPARERVADRLVRHHDHDRKTASDEFIIGKQPATCEFMMTLATETAGGFLVRATGTSLGAVESEGCRTVVEQIAREQGWAVDGSQVERLRARENEYTRLFLFQERMTEQDRDQRVSKQSEATTQ